MISFLLASVLLCHPLLEDFLQKEPAGDHRKGEIEIVQDRAQIEAIEQGQIRRWMKKGFSEERAREWARTGVVAEDAYWIWLRDPVLFPSGSSGTYDRLLWKSALSGPPGAVVVPLLPDGRIVLNLNFRHATRSWEFELPRGGSLEGETAEETASRELREETGLEPQKLRLLGHLAPDTGALSSIVPVYAGWVAERQRERAAESAGESAPEDSEAIAGILGFTREELETGFQNGYLETPSHGRVPLRDPFLAFALLQLQRLPIDENKHPIRNESMTERPKVGVGVLVIDGRSILMGKRHASHGEGKWATPGGHLEFGETAETCAARELYEETGLKALSIRKGPWTNDVIDGNKHYITIFMIVDKFEGHLENKEPHKCEKWEWHPWDDLPDPLFDPVHSLKKLNFHVFGKGI